MKEEFDDSFWVYALLIILALSVAVTMITISTRGKHEASNDNTPIGIPDVRVRDKVDSNDIR